MLEFGGWLSHFTGFHLGDAAAERWRSRSLPTQPSYLGVYRLAFPQLLFWSCHAINKSSKKGRALQCSGGRLSVLYSQAASAASFFLPVPLLSLSLLRALGSSNNAFSESLQKAE